MEKNYYCRNRNWLQKGLRIMKITTFLCLISIIQALAIPSMGQAKLDMRMKNTTIEEALRKMEESTNFRFFYQSKDMENRQLIDFEFKQKTVFEILDSVLPQLHLKYEVFDNYIAIKSAREDLSKHNSIQKQKSVSGKVTDSSGLPLPGVTVILKGTTQGTITDTEGVYSISEVPDDAILVFSFVGMKMQEVSVDGKTSINVILTEESIGIEEVVAIGYGTMKKSDITGSVASIKAETLEKASVSRVEQALQGKLSGVYVQNTSAEPNAEIRIRIRGANSINGDNSPLIVIDGFQGGDMNTLSPNDIESIEVLKDASATAIYGSRGANGVILVTTKSGKKGKTVISYDSFFSLQQVRKKLELLDGARYAQVVNENRVEIGQLPVFSDQEISEFRLSGGTNWQDEIMRDAFAQNHQLSISGGNNDLNYYISGGVEDKDGIVINTSYKRYNLRSNLSAQLTEKLKVDAKLYLSKEENNPTNLQTYGGTNDGSPLYSALIFAPVLPVYDEDGDYVRASGSFGPPTNSNPLALAKEPIRNEYTNTVNVNTGIEYKIVNGLTLDISGGYKLVDYEFNHYFNTKPGGNTGSELVQIINGKRSILQNSNMLTYNKLFNEAHNLTITAVYEQQKEKYNQLTTASKGFFTDAIEYNNIALGTTVQRPSNNMFTRRLESFMGRVNYSYKSKYLLTLTARSDGSSVFGKNNKRGFFPSAALGWNVTSESFMDGLKDKISNLKLRVSWGVTGNQAIRPYSTLAKLSTSSYPSYAAYPTNGGSTSVGVSQKSIANPDLKWEKTTQFNAGTDIQLISGRIEMIFDYYKKNTEDLLLSVPLPLTSGVGSVLKNVGEVENKGFELYLGGTPVKGNFVWNTGITFAKNKNEVLSLRDGLDKISLGDAGLPGFGSARVLKVGEPLGLYEGYEQNGVWKASEADQAAVYGVIPGSPKLVDQNDDDKINESDKVIIADAQPDFTYGWSNTFSYKDFDLNILMQGVYGNKILNLGRVRMEMSNTDGDATSPSILNRWTSDNENTDIPSFSGQNASPSFQTDHWVEDGSYLGIKDITLGYTLPTSFAQKLKISSARVYVSGSNLITITNYSGFDPEVASSTSDRLLGVDVAAYPAQKIFTIGLNLKF